MRSEVSTPVVMNKSTWDGLEKEDQSAIQRAAEIAYNTLGSVMNQSFNTQVDDLTKSGAKVRILQHEELTQWEKVTQYQKAQANWVKESESKGITGAGQALEQITSIMNDVMK